MADAKALGLLTVFGVLIGLILDRSKGSLSDFENALVVGTLIVSGMVMLAAGFVVFPRTRGRPRGTIYWKAIRSQTEQEFLATFRDASEADLAEILTRHTYEVAGIANQKYNALEFAFGAGALALTIGFITLAVT